MAEIDKIKEKLDQLKKKYDHLFKVFLLFLTGTGLTGYNVLVGDKPFFVVVVTVALGASTIWILKEMKKINDKIDDLIDKLGEL